MKVLIVKTSSLGDIVQALSVVNDLHNRLPQASIDWAVEAPFVSIVAAHPLLRRAISLDRNCLYASLKNLRKERYDLIFDLQGNCKSGVITWLSRGKTKIGYGLQSVREWPNIFATSVRFNVSKQENIRTFYLGLIERYFQSPSLTDNFAAPFHLSLEDQAEVDAILKRLPPVLKIMVCPGSKWANKQLHPATLAAFLQKIKGACFLFMWGDPTEKALCENLASQLPSALVVDKLSIAAWQHLMSRVDLVVALDSSALHLCGTTSTPSFSVFGPTSSQVFKPLGAHHVAVQGVCPYGRKFEKQCPVLRSCPTGACMKNLTAEELFAAFQNQRASLQL